MSKQVPNHRCCLQVGPAFTHHYIKSFSVTCLLTPLPLELCQTVCKVKWKQAKISF